jgi:hypothetical protein
MIAAMTYVAGAVTIAAIDLRDPMPGNRIRDTALLSVLWPAWTALAIAVVAWSVMGPAPGDDEVDW